jgi:phage baseplate assembly protein W
MSIQPSVPFALTPGGAVSVDTDPNLQISKRIRTLVSTFPGERVMRNTYGIPLASLLFEPEDEAAQGLLEEWVTDAIATWEPGVVVRVVNPVWNLEGDQMIAVDVDFQRTESPDTAAGLSQRINVATIEVGGEVTETVIG